MTPNWLSRLSSSTLCGGNIHRCSWGQKKPNRLGPSMMPATISPMTCGWRIRANSSPIARLSATISATWSRSRKMRL